MRQVLDEVDADAATSEWRDSSSQRTRPPTGDALDKAAKPQLAALVFAVI